MALEKLRAALAARKSAEKTTQPIPLARAEVLKNIKIFESNDLRIFEEISVHPADNFQNHQPQITYASRKSKKIPRN